MWRTLTKILFYLFVPPTALRDLTPLFEIKQAKRQRLRGLQQGYLADVELAGCSTDHVCENCPISADFRSERPGG